MKQYDIVLVESEDFNISLDEAVGDKRIVVEGFEFFFDNEAKILMVVNATKDLPDFPWFDNEALSNKEIKNKLLAYLRWERVSFNTTYPKSLNASYINKILQTVNIKPDVAYVTPDNWVDVASNFAAQKRYDAPFANTPSQNNITQCSYYTQYGEISIRPSKNVSSDQIMFENTVTKITNIQNLNLPHGCITVSYLAGTRNDQIITKIINAVQTYPDFELKFEANVPDHVKKRVNNLLIFS